MRNIYTKDGIVKMRIGGIFTVSAGSWTREMYLKNAWKYYRRREK